ncbi:1-deoxy-D-xylulose-5-phosphate reductoisomerase [Candidatus Woesearchaeota archaeon]|nr:1-deoxy-D-xylulose-5-phosphate reductoisomerase [Candidatus Woesearchaeota archaeon]
MKNISILGSTGSIGTQALEVIRNNPSEFKVKGLACNSNISLLKKQIGEFKPEAACVYDKDKADSVSLDIPVYSGMDGLIKLAKLESTDTILNSLVGSIGVKPTVEAIKAKKNIALANKETLVTAGDIVMELVEKNNAELKPIDSEHSAIFQCLNGERKEDVKKLIITCSGGAFRDKSIEEINNLKAADALKHPNWNMGAKITIDSASLMNKGLEVIEAHYLFGVAYDNIDVVIHPQSIIHSLVEFKDTSVKAQLGWPDMKIPIQYALSHPFRLSNNLKSLDLVEVGELNFSKPDLSRFPCLSYAYSAGKTGGSMPAVMNAANEIAVGAFLEGKIGFMDIPRLVKEAMDEHKIIKNPGLDEILEINRKVKVKDIGKI